ncbi:glycosyltransferase family 9 protein [bacterium]|nr:glycosyltransferase family 9 protein [bacterium]
MASRDPRRIVIMDWSMIGDLVMLSPCVRAVRSAWPEAHLAVLGQPASISSYRFDPAVNELIPYDRSKGDWNMASFGAAVQALKAGSFDLAFIFHNSFGSALMALLGGVKERVGYRSEMRDLLLTRSFSRPDMREHLIEEKAFLLQSYGVEVRDYSEKVYIDEERAKVWLKDKLGPNFGRSRPIVALSVGATVEHKRWPLESFNKLLNLFPVNSVDFVFLGSPAERVHFEGVYSYNNTVVDLVGQTTIEELSWVLDKADLFIGPDSGPVHLAVGRQRPVVVLFGPTDPARCGPFQYANSITVRAEGICSRCDARFGSQLHNRTCLHTIGAQTVYDAAARLLAATCPRWRP